MAVKTPIKATFSGSDVNGLAEYESGDFIGVAAGGTGAVTHTANSILLGNGTSALQSSEIQISGTTLSSSDSTTISIAEGLIVTGDLTVQGTTTTVDSSTINVVDRFVFEGSSDDANETTLIASNPDADRTVTIPNATGTIVLKDTTDTLTNKTISGSSNTLSNIGNSSLSNSTITVSADSGSNNALDLGDTFTISGGEGIDTSVSGDEITIAGEEASTSNKGVASFSSDNFSVSSGAVTIKDDGIATAEIQDDAVTTAKIPDSAVTNAKLAGSIANAKLANSSITINGSSVSLGGSATITGSELSAGDIFSNPNTISSDATFTTASTKNAFLKGEITVSGNAVMTIDGDGVLELF